MMSRIPLVNFRLSVKEAAQKGSVRAAMPAMLALIAVAVAMVAAPIVPVAMLRFVAMAGFAGMTRTIIIRISGIGFHARLDDLVQFAPVEPNATTLWAVINLDTLPFAHYQAYPADRTLHSRRRFVLDHIAEPFIRGARCATDFEVGRHAARGSRECDNITSSECWRRRRLQCCSGGIGRQGFDDPALGDRATSTLSNQPIEFAL